MNIEEIKAAVSQGKTVHWVNKAYTVIHCNLAGFLIKCNFNNSYVGLHGRGKFENQLNGKPEEFYIE